ncbi:hypothetical protein RMATCC62417_03858 [Rhizopus microsporus]|nr:hypothetical protein RMATCC62417_03858 [Rhizopus microsporus]
METYVSPFSSRGYLITYEISNIPNLPKNLFIQVDPDNIKKNEFIELMLRQNNLDTLEPYIDALAELKKNLIHLSLRDNRFPSFPIELILLTNLTSLSLAENRIGRIADGMMSRLPNLQWLNLSKNRLRVLPADIVKCSQLRGLDVTSNKLTQFPDAVCSLSLLKILLLDKNKIENILSNHKLPVKLEVLSLGSNKLTKIPSCLIHDPPLTLTHLDLSENALTMLPFAFMSEGYESLVSLDLHSCKLACCPSWLFVRLSKCYRLRRLNLSLNQLKTMPNEVCLLTQLQWLNVNGNRLTAIPESLSKLTNLVKLGIAQNNIELLPPLLFVHMQKLAKLDVRKNRLTYYPPSLLSTVKTHDRFTNRDFYVPQKVFSSFDLRSTCNRHIRKPSFYDTLFGSRICDHCHPFGGELDELYTAGNVKLQYVTGLICNLQEKKHGDSVPVQAMSLQGAFDIISASPNADDINVKSILRKALFEKSGDGQMSYCADKRFSQRNYTYNIPSDTAQPVNSEYETPVEERVRLALTSIPSLREISLRTYLNTTDKGFYDDKYEDYGEYAGKERRMDHNPTRVKRFIKAVLPPIPALAVDDCRQCDYCLQWYRQSIIQVAIISVLPDIGTTTPIRYSLCSLNCALDSLLNMYRSTKEWEVKSRVARRYHN